MKTNLLKNWLKNHITTIAIVSVGANIILGVLLVSVVNTLRNGCNDINAIAMQSHVK